MANMSTKSVVLDTSFLVALTISDRPNHEVAVRYFQHWVESCVQMYIPMIVYTEYLAYTDKIPDYILRRVIVKSFGLEEAEISARIQRERVIVRGDDGQPRAVFKDDIKIIGSACAIGALAIAHDDDSTMSKYINNAATKIKDAKRLRSICIRDGYNRGVADLSAPDLGL